MASLKIDEVGKSLFQSLLLWVRFHSRWRVRMKIVSRLPSCLGWAAPALLLAIPVLGQETPLPPQTTSSWAANDALYWGLPVLAVLISWIVGIGWHFGEARKQYAEWPATTASGSFGSLCGLPIALTIVLFLAVAGFFVYLWF